ncbi:transmembrane protein 170B isoform X1 [Lynx rufus]|uniref:transmembrane protein 170B isoform X1 n=1 Tax=Lynx rufus TaxID=61384 RepID=UPI001F122DEF|nr:transmembrane protein 170B isoform X1 [Lynx rufus]
MKAEGGDHSMINLSVQQVLSLWAHGTVLRNLTEMWYWIFLWALFSSLFVHGAAGVLMFVMLQRHRQGRVISVIAVSIGFLASVTGAMITTPMLRPCDAGCRLDLRTTACQPLIRLHKLTEPTLLKPNLPWPSRPLSLSGTMEGDPNHFHRCGAVGPLCCWILTSSVHWWLFV